MPDWEVPLSEVSYTDADVEAVSETYRSGWISMGPRTQDLERDFAAFTGAEHAIAVTNGTAALHLACLAAGLEEGDEVIVPSLTFVATVNAIRYTGATPVFADIAALDRPWLSVDTVAPLIGERTKAIMTMTYGGHPGETAPIEALADRKGLILLEDAAHGLGGRAGDRALGTIGLAGAFSFFANKNLPVGEGGMVATGDDAVAEQVRLLRSHGMTSLTWDRHRGHAQSYDVVGLGFNYRIDEPRATLASARLARLADDNARRAAIASAYSERLGDRSDMLMPVPPPPEDQSAHHLATVVLDEDVVRDAVRAALAEARIQTSLHYPPAHRFSIYEDLPSDLPLTEEYARRAVTLPLFPDMTEAQADLVMDSLIAATSDSARTASNSAE